jgi:hypothetical protein
MSQKLVGFKSPASSCTLEAGIKAMVFVPVEDTRTEALQPFSEADVTDPACTPMWQTSKFISGTGDGRKSPNKPEKASIKRTAACPWIFEAALAFVLRSGGFAMLALSLDFTWLANAAAKPAAAPATVS